MFVDVDADFLEDEQELRVREAEHAQGLLIAEPGGDGGAIRWLQVGDREWDFLVQRHHLDAPGRADGEGGVEEVERVGLACNVEIVKVSEELRCALLLDPEAGTNTEAGVGGGLLVDRF